MFNRNLMLCWPCLPIRAGNETNLMHYLFSVSSDVVRAHQVTRHNTPIHNILSTPKLSISQKALGTFPEDGNVLPIHV
jgi:hypothetical protein